MGHEQNRLPVMLPAALAFGGGFMANDWFVIDLRRLHQFDIPYPDVLHAVPWIAAVVAMFVWLLLGRRRPWRGGVAAFAIFWACVVGTLRWVDWQVERVAVQRELREDELELLNARLGFKVMRKGRTTLLIARQSGHAAALAAEVQCMSSAASP